MVASRFDNSLYSRPWMARTGVYPGQPAAAPAAVADTPGTTANAPLQVMAGSVPTSPVFMPQGQGEGIGGGGMDPSTSGYGVSPDFGSWATNVLAGLGMLTGPFGAMIAGGRILGTMLTDPTRTTMIGVNDLGWGNLFGGAPEKGPETFGPTAPDASFAYGAGMKGDLGFDGTKSDFSGFGGEIGGPTTAGSPEADPGVADGTGVGDGTHGDGLGEARYGGYIPDPDGDDRTSPVPLTAHSGEFVLRPEAVAALGLPFVQRMNEAGPGQANKLMALARRQDWQPAATARRYQ